MADDTLRKKKETVEIPSFIPTPYQNLAVSLFGSMARKSSKNTPLLSKMLDSANIQVKNEVFIASVWLTVAISVILSLILATVVLMISIVFGFSFIDNFASGNYMNGIIQIFILLAIVILIPLFTYYIAFHYPNMKAKARKRDMEANLAYAVNFISALASANATPLNIFKTLGTQVEIYGEIAHDARRIYKDVALVGMDIITALKLAIVRSPSPEYRDFIQGITSTLQSGGSLKSYFNNKAEEYMREHEGVQEEFVETLAFMAESYVVVAVAMPIFLMVMLVIMYWISGKGSSLGEPLLYAVIFVMLPLTHVGYLLGVDFMTPEV